MKKNLNELQIGQSAKVIKINAEGTMKRRLLDIGLIPGAIVSCELVSPLKDPKAYEIKGALIALREEDAKSILVGEC